MAKLILALFLVVSFVARAESPYERKLLAIGKSRAPEAKRLKELFDLSWRHEMEDSPTFATAVGYPGLNHRWNDVSKEAIARRHREAETLLKVTGTFRDAKLSDADRVNLDLFRYQARQRVELGRFHGEFLAISQLDGPQQELADTLETNPAVTEKDYADILTRLETIPTVLAQVTALLRDGAKAGITPPRVTLRDVPAQIDAQLVDDVDKSPLTGAFRKIPASFPEARRKALRDRATVVLKEKVVPAFQAFRDFVAKEYLPAARETVAFSALPDGKNWYDVLVAHSTTTSLTAKQVHEIGLAEVKRLRAAMDAVMKEAGFKGSFEEFKELLRTDKRFFYESAEELLRGYRDIAKRIDPGLVKLFGKLPRLPYGVTPVPAYAEKSQTTAYYEPGSLKAGRPGWYFANTYDLKTRPKWEMEALTLHEAVPGHHLQISLAQEMESVPEFRKHLGFTAFVEGWGLYAESLGYDLGLYGDPYSKFGQLTYEMWRAVRLVVDTGIHALGWSREKAIEYFKENAAKTEHDIVVEIDRYIVWPGQALAYKIGQMKFTELREAARKQLGDRFDIRQFHDAALENGAVPLSTLENAVRRWMTKAASRKPSSDTQE